MSGEHWLDAQRALVERYVAGTAAGERRRVKFRWRTTQSGRSGDVRGTPVGLLWSVVRGGRMSGDGVHVALYELADPPGASPFVMFDVPAETFDAVGARGVGRVGARLDRSRVGLT